MELVKRTTMCVTHLLDVVGKLVAVLSGEGRGGGANAGEWPVIGPGTEAL